MPIWLTGIFVQIYTGIKNLQNPADPIFSFAQAEALAEIESCWNALQCLEAASTNTELRHSALTGNNGWAV